MSYKDSLKLTCYKCYRKLSTLEMENFLSQRKKTVNLGDRKLSVQDKGKISIPGTENFDRKNICSAESQANQISIGVDQKKLSLLSAFACNCHSK